MDTYYFKFARGGGKSCQTQWMMYKMLVLEGLDICKFKPMIIRKEKNMERMTQLVSLKGWHDGEPVAAWMCECPDDHAYVVENDMCGDVNRYILGPIVDRLYEYEQLGMTPAEIRDGMRHDLELISKLRTENAAQKKELQETIDSCEAYRVELRNAKKEKEKLEKIIADLRNDKRLLEMANMDLHTNMNVISAENKRLRGQIDKYDLVIHTIEQLFGCAFDI